MDFTPCELLIMLTKFEWLPDQKGKTKKIQDVLSVTAKSQQTSPCSLL